MRGRGGAAAGPPAGRTGPPVALGLLASLCEAMDLPLSDVLRDVADAVAVEELAIVRSTPIAAARPTGDVVASAA